MPEPRGAGEAVGFGVGVANEFGTGVGLWAKVIKQAIGAPRSVPQTTASLIDWTGDIGLRPFLRDVV